jgi:sigma-B regulation protein RsbU (phosphoserine phosphatase)
LNQLSPTKIATVFVFESEVASQIVSSQKNDQYTFVFNKILQPLLGDANSLSQFEQFLETNKTKKWADSETGLIKSENNESWIYSSSPIIGTDLIVINFVSEKKAFSVLNQIYFKSFFSFILILSLVVIVGIISATYLTEKLKSLTIATQKVIGGDFESEVAVAGNDEISLLSVDFNHMVKQIKRLMSETAEQARMENELKTAQLVQENLFPKESHHYSNCSVAGYCKPATECGGDWWFHSEDEKNVNIIIADATGHGVPAALMTSAIKSAFVVTAKLNLTTEETIAKINEALCEVGRNKVMMTAFYIRINKKTNSAEYINSSHEAPFILNLNSEVIDKNDFIYLNEKVSARLGQSPDTVFSAIPIQLHSKQRLFLYTDGIFDLKNSADKKLTERQFHKKVTEIANEKTDLLTYSKNIRNFIFDYHTHKNLEDDVTLCHIEVT